MGYVTLNEFNILLKRLSINLSNHRIREIYTYVKDTKKGTSKKNKSVLDAYLTKEEFCHALEYIHNNSVIMVTSRLGVSLEILLFGFLYTVLILVLIFVFIFLGYEGFSNADSFESSVSSLYPIS